MAGPVRSNLSMRISICGSSFGQVRLTTRSGTTFDCAVVRSEYVPTVHLVTPIGFEVAFGEHVPELLRVVEGRLAAAERVDEPHAVPDVDKLRKALEWPTELPPKSSAAAIKRADAAIAAAADDALERTIEQALAAGLTIFKNSDAVVARLATPARLRLLEAAAETGAAGVLTALLAATPEADRNWLLVRAAVKGKIHGVAALLAAGADVDAVAPSLRDDPDTRPALHWAVHHGHRPVVRQLLQAGARVTGSPALAWSIVRAPDPVTWQLLLAAGLDVNARDRHGDPLLLALGRNGLTEMLDRAIAAGADVNAAYPDGSTLLLHAIDLAAHTGRSPFFIENLLRAGADPDAGRLHGRNPLALALEVPHDPGASRGERWIAKWLTAAGAVAAADPDAPPLAREQPPAPPVWSARIDPNLARAAHYDVLGVRFTPSQISADLESAPPPDLGGGLGSDTIAVARAKLEHLVGPPPSRGDEYKTTFEYTFLATLGDARLAVHIGDWKARELALAIQPHPDAAVRDRITAAFHELLIVSPLAAFRDRLRFDEYSGCAYHSDGKTAFAALPKSK